MISNDLAEGLIVEKSRAPAVIGKKLTSADCCLANREASRRFSRI